MMSRRNRRNGRNTPQLLDSLDNKEGRPIKGLKIIKKLNQKIIKNPCIIAVPYQGTLNLVILSEATRKHETINWNLIFNVRHEETIIGDCGEGAGSSIDCVPDSTGNHQLHVKWGMTNVELGMVACGDYQWKILHLNIAAKREPFNIQHSTFKI